MNVNPCSPGRVPLRGGGRIAHLFTVLLLVTTAGLLSAVLYPIPAVTGHGPSGVELSYDHGEQQLSVTITHSVGDPDTHYIDTVRIDKNDTLYATYTYTSQPDASTFTYVYNVSAGDGDELEATAECNQGGSRTGKLTVEDEGGGNGNGNGGENGNGNGNGEPAITVTLTPAISALNRSESVTFTIRALSEGEPVEGADVDVDARRGDVSDPTETGGGNYTFTYTAPDNRTGETETIEVRVRKDGYSDGEAEVSFTLRDPDAPPPSSGTLDGVVTPGEYAFSAEFDGGNMVVHWSINGDILSMALVTRTTGWVAIGFQPTTAMKDADMIFGWVDDQGGVHIKDAFSTGATGPHPPDTELGGTHDILAFGGAESGGVTTLEFTRHLDTGDRFDAVIPATGSMTIIWAYGGSDSFDSQHERSSRGTGSITMDTGESSEEDTVELWPVHALFMTLGMLSMLGAVYIARFRKKERWWLKYHRTLGLAGAGSVITGLMVGFYMVEDATGEHFRVGHAYFGLLTILMAILTPSVGLLMFRFRKHIKTLKTAHRWLGRITIVFMILTILGGLNAAGML